jgi:hypothetical protein
MKCTLVRTLTFAQDAILNQKRIRTLHDSLRNDVADIEVGQSSDQRSHWELLEYLRAQLNGKPQDQEPGSKMWWGRVQMV